MDTAVDDFLKEINELLPPKPKIVWKECFDEASGFAYYWNTETDEVTWEAPAEYKKQSKAGNKLYIPPPSEPKFKLCALPRVDEVNVKIYKINEGIPATAKDVKPKPAVVDEVQRLGNANEKVALISSYGSSSESDSENEQNKEDLLSMDSTVLGPELPNAEQCPSKPETDENHSDASDFDDEVDILTQIQKKANDLKKLGGEIPSEVRKLIEAPALQKKGVSLVPGYGDDSDDEPERDAQPLFPVAAERAEPSVLFPAAKNIDVVEQPPANVTTGADEIDAKAFQRKRRIGVSLMNTSKKKVVESAERDRTNENEKQQVVTNKKVEYAGFTSGGVLFGNAGDNENVNVETEKGDEQTDNGRAQKDETENEEKLVSQIKQIRDTLEEKLKFLCEGHQHALPVQVMIIQMETLYTAMCENCLKPTYLKNWLNTTLEDLTKLEKEAAPAGWLLQWDRTHKRYYYHNQATGDSQWEFPQADAIRTEEAMDISMTPPHATCDESSSNNGNLEREAVVPPPPPSIREKSISPPPAPIISKATNAIEQPLPPGVDEDLVEKVNGKLENGGSFSSELTSFYSDIAAIESSLPQNNVQNDAEVLKPEIAVKEPPKKKKKVKVASGLAMKKKGVSQMVEKWKNLQKNYD